MTSPGPTLSEAFAVLGLHGPMDQEAVTRAFRLAVKTARPDTDGGDAERFRRVIAAYRLIQSTGERPAALAAPAQASATLPVVGLTPQQAIAGGRVEVRLGGRTLRIVAPAGMRTGEHLRLRGAGPEGGDLYLPVLIRPTDGLSAFGDDLFMDWSVPLRLLCDGGRVEIDTHAGVRSAWVTPGLHTPVRLRLRDLGLPARGSRPQGHLFVALKPSRDAPSAAEDLLARFTRVWTPGRMAA
ncbi:MAG: DnaJ C-terminal domain-containing protein [Brevundimonas sp.]|uniref:DnaJ C-terminal domain-containing protein n=1 Tax=Brevundimonas sp. TaxID=1871086 RepID=UPI00273687A3|nr:DnaJ C-terminal domain-containing protein [Brevundimonas sp.]MDP3405570.1 DnaJ C-terminal domain-containing protein [Brevundimonas sp.]